MLGNINSPIHKSSPLNAMQTPKMEDLLPILYQNCCGLWRHIYFYIVPLLLLLIYIVQVYIV